jgi:motility quorum-sensing regulator / GCU-specific mRNA interferase toxin
MEKGTPHCKLAVIKAMAEAGKIRATATASRTARQLGMRFDDMVAVVLALTPADFYKSMTSHDDYRVWQDVYQPTTSAGDVYLKLTVVDDVLIVSFKEL